MKYVLIIPDGMADFPIQELSLKTPVEKANTPNLDKITSNGKLGLCHTTPESMQPGSDICILSLLGYNPMTCYSGRAPLEAASLNIPMNDSDLIFRCNLINIDDNNKITDHSAGHITTNESKSIIESLNKKLKNDLLEFFPGTSYRNILKFNNYPSIEALTTPPHDVPGELYKNHLPRGKDSKMIIDLIEKSKDILKDHPVNISRRNKNLKEANLIWIWGGGYKPKLKNFYDQFSVKSAVISAVDLIKGLAKSININVIDVPGITGHFDTNYKGKGEYAIKALNNFDFLIIHIEAPDEAGHVGDLKEKIKAIEEIDKHIIGPIFDYLKKQDKYRILISPDHYTPIEKRIHIGNPVPFVIQGYGIDASKETSYSERNADKSNLIFKNGFELMPFFIN